MYSKDKPAVVASSSRKLTADQIAGLTARCDEIRSKIGSGTSLTFSDENKSGAEGYDAACVYNKKYILVHINKYYQQWMIKTTLNYYVCM